jgi:UPF0755 protein
MKKFLFTLLILFLMTAVLGYYFFFASVKIDEDLILQIELGSSPSKIARQLKEVGLIRSEKVFLLELKLLGKTDLLKAGYYQFPANSSWTIVDLIDYLQSGQVSAEQWMLLMREGETIFELKEYLAKQGVDLADWDNLILAGTWQNRYTFLQGVTVGNSLEGFLFPDTYYFDKQASLNNILETLLTHFGEKTAEIRQVAKNKNLDWYELLRLASIVEWEVRTPANRALVADIFWRRYHDKYLLQSDATLNYLREKSERVDSNTYKDLENTSPYNTYKHIGLPPTPINNPSLGAMEAVLNPTANDYYYFVTSLAGNIYYSKTYDEHLVNVKKAKNDQ